MHLYFDLERPQFGSKQRTESESDECQSEAWISFAAFPPRSEVYETSAGDRIAREDDVPLTEDRPNLIKASVYVERSTTETGKSSIRYREASAHGNAEVYIDVRLSPVTFDALRADLRTGLGPSYMVVGLDSHFANGPIKYGNAPSGSHKVWTVVSSENQTLPIREVSFIYTKTEAAPPTNDDVEAAERLRDEREIDIRQRIAIIEALKALRQGINVLALLIVLLGVVLWFR